MDRWSDRVVLAGFRIAAFLVVAACLMRPGLALSSAVPQRNVLAVLLDDSRSMQIADAGKDRRVAAEQRVFGDSTALVRQLGDRFALRFFRFAADAAPINTVADLHASGTRTDIAASLESARQELADVPLGGIVVVSDGADNAAGDLTATLLALRARHVPVYTVGVGRERFDRDLSIDRFELPATTLAGAGVAATVSLGIRGVAGDSAALTVEADGHIVAARQVLLPAHREVVDVPLRLPPLPAGTHTIAVRVAPLKGEMVTENNDAAAMLRVRPARERVLYFEGSPRYEFPFIRRAIAGDSGLQMAALLRSAKGKFLRLNVLDSLDLIGGFPTRPEELFRYRALILGDVEASYFTGDQLRMIADFVDRRGGALIALGGRNALAEGNYGGTPVADALPFALDAQPHRADTLAVTLKVHPTDAGLVHPALQLGTTLTQDTARWDSLPAVTSVNQPGTVRPGATVLLSGRSTPRGPDRPVLAVQHYGRGIAAVLDIQDSWLWKMDPRSPVEDQSFETFWRQLIRWSLDQVPDRVEVTPVPARVGPGEPVTVEVRAVDSLYHDMNDASVTAHVTSPSGHTVDVPLAWTLREDGTYSAKYVPTEQGTYQLTADARRGNDTVRSAVGGILVDGRGADMERAELRTPLLERIASETGGKYYPIDALQQLPEDVTLTESGIVAHESRDLWDMPVVLLLLLLLLGAEWGYRRWRGLA
ncbi:MAG TPA: hypothetical protein VHW65_11790 [Gemmatimonadales bacterium]|nr:hypothetical protein [Gemmatimonadales bacterium]